ncbi:hypothetical protein NW767_000779 [Fusarium falciforme]|nr:hypothetical protein NW767_000779 [Fusarium falciforme]
MAVGMPVDPAWYNAFLKAKELGCLAEIVTIACLLSTQDDIIMGPKAPRYAADVFGSNTLMPSPTTWHD